LSISGYPIAIFTGVYRALNNKHWVGDVVAGAGFGILSTEIAYWLYPKINHGSLKTKKIRLFSSLLFIKTKLLD
jgi:membrane-associated phospholipid phosphatase